MMKKLLIILAAIFLITCSGKEEHADPIPDFTSATIEGHLPSLSGSEIKLEGFDGLNTYKISSADIDALGNFKLTYSKADYGVGYLISSDEKPLFIILSGEDIVLEGEALSFTETIQIKRGKENQWFEQYAQEHPKREQAISAWMYLEQLYTMDSLFAVQQSTVQDIRTEKKRIKDEEAAFLAGLQKGSYISWYLPVRTFISSVSVIAQYRQEEIPATIAAFRALDYTDQRLYKSGLFKDAIESHFWLLENSGKSLDSVFIEMQLSIDAMMANLIKNENIFNEVTNYLFDLLERQSLFQAAEYLALNVLNEEACTIDSDLAKQLESYRAMKKGNIAPDIHFAERTYLNGIKQSKISNLSSLNTPYTFVIFGASWCPKCLEELPNAIQKYANWRNLGVEVVYISLDTDQTSFEQAVKNYPFFAYCDFNKWDSKVVKDYYVYSTPTFFLLNNKREIILRPNSISQMDAWVDWFLIQGNKK